METTTAVDRETLEAVLAVLRAQLIRSMGARDWLLDRSHQTGTGVDARTVSHYEGVVTAIQESIHLVLAMRGKEG